ncbi:MAG: hypothetical protein AB1432_11190 [Bacteroidota bacterium]|jgi:hypothetical protein
MKYNKKRIDSEFKAKVLLESLSNEEKTFFNNTLSQSERGKKSDLVENKEAHTFKQPTIIYE